MIYLERLLTYDFQHMSPAQRLVMLLIYEFGPPAGGHNALLIEILSGLPRREFYSTLEDLERDGWLDAGCPAAGLDPTALV